MTVGQNVLINCLVCENMTIFRAKAYSFTTTGTEVHLEFFHFESLALGKPAALLCRIRKSSKYTLCCSGISSLNHKGAVNNRSFFHALLSGDRLVAEIDISVAERTGICQLQA